MWSSAVIPAYASGTVKETATLWTTSVVWSDTGTTAEAACEAAFSEMTSNGAIVCAPQICIYTYTGINSDSGLYYCSGDVTWSLGDGSPFHTNSVVRFVELYPLSPSACPAHSTRKDSACICDDTYSPDDAGTSCVSKCPIDDLPPITDPEVQAFEDNPNRSDTANLNPTMQTALQRLVDAASSAGGAPSVGSAYRPPAYNQHLIDVWNKWMGELKKEERPACLDLRTIIHQHFQRHGLIEAQPPVANSRHTRGLAVDVTINLPPTNIDALAHGAGLNRPLPIADPVHFQFP